MMEKLDLTQLNQNIIKKIDEKNYRAAIEEASGMIALARMTDVSKYFLLGKYYLGVCYHNLHDYKYSMDKYVELTNLFLNSEVNLDELGFDSGFLDRVRYGMALDMYYLGDLDGGSTVLQYILKHSSEKDVILDSIILLGFIYLRMYEVNEDLNSLAYTLEMYLTLIEEVSLSRSKTMLVYNTLSILFTYHKDYDKAQEMLNKSFLNAGNSREFFPIFNRMGWINLKMNNLKKAQKNVEKAVENLDRTVEPIEEGFYYLLWGLLNKEEEQYPEAQRLMEKSLSFAKKLNCSLEQVRIYRELAALYDTMNLGYNSEYLLKYEEAKSGVSLVKEVVNWSEIWQGIKERF